MLASKLIRPALFSTCSVNSYRIVSEKNIVKPYGRIVSGTDSKNPSKTEIPTHCDVAIIGGGGMGSSAAYFLKKMAGKDLNVVVIERDSTYSKASTPLSVGCIRQRYTVVENVLMSRFGAEFLKSAKQELGDDVDPNFKIFGCLTLAGADTAPDLLKCSDVQRELGVKNEILIGEKLKERFPWINTDGVALGCVSYENEGWFDPWALLTGFRKKAQSLGAQYVEGEVVDFEFKSSGKSWDPVSEVPAALIVQTSDNERQTITFEKCVLAAGAYSGELAKKARIGTGQGVLSTPLPIEPRKRYVFIVNSQGENIPPQDAPLVLDTRKLYFRRDGTAGNFITGRSPPADKEPSTDNLDVDWDFFETEIWPHLAHRVPAFESLKVSGAWAGYYDFNAFDVNGVIGKHPCYDNFYIAAGFSGHGIQKVPAVGRSIAELIVNGSFETIDLTLFHFDRIVQGKRIIERALA